MVNSSNKVTTYVIVGPTASGKTSASISLAEHVNGEVISGDSVQIYRGLDIASGKATRTEMSGIPHHLLDVCDPGQNFTVEDYRQLGNQAVEEILNNNHTPIIAGGTGFYIDTLVKNVKYPNIDKKIKARLKDLAVRPLIKLAQGTLPPEVWDSFDNQNPARVRNRLGLWQTHGSIPQPKTFDRPHHIDFIWLGINPGKEILRRNIIKRTDERLKGGMIDEVKSLLDSGVSADWLQSVGMEYSLLTDYILNNTTIDKLRSDIIQADINYAKRQMTWFKRNKEITWFTSPTELIKHNLMANG